MKQIPRLILCISILVLIVFLSSSELYARAGGGGGGGGGGFSSGSSSGGGEPETILIMIGIVFIVSVSGFISSSSKKKRLNKEKKIFLINNPDFDPEAFKKKVELSFFAIQDAWSRKDLTKVRKYISDGFYQRFISQFKMMDTFLQTNVLSKIRLKKLHIDSYKEDGPFDIIHIEIDGSMKDQLKCELKSSINKKNNGSFTEFWSFIRKKNHIAKDLYSTDLCPNCEAKLQPLGKASKCSYCNCILNSGKFDWVLYKITQSSAYDKEYSISKKAAIHAKIGELKKIDPEFSVQSIENKASNAYLQILLSHTKKDLSLVRRFVTNKIFFQLEEALPKETEVFNQLCLNEINLINAASKNGKHIVAISLCSTGQKVILKDDKLKLKDQKIAFQSMVIFLTCDDSGAKNPDTLYTHNCPSCGKDIIDSLDINCIHCGEQLNLFENDWIVSGYMPKKEYEESYTYNTSEELESLIW
ncbi:MAG: TIM44-like domain-containing protein [Desulfobacteraceae bacterium]|nr:TIM44-like domain-containing protein [Desulfobacteraceae bacterium]